MFLWEQTGRQFCGTRLRPDEQSRCGGEEEKEMSNLRVTAGPFVFMARFEEQSAPETCAAFRRHLPFESRAVHVRWSGEAIWLPLGDLNFGVGYENATSYPAPGQILLYPGVSARRRFCSATARCNSPRRPGSLPAIIS